MTSNGSGESRKLDGLQLGRAVAAILVVIGHAITHPLPATPSLAHLMGRYGVILFFVISGFIMVHTTGPDRFSPKRFMERRITRIVPLYYFATLVTAALALVVPSALKTTRFDLDYLIASLFFIPQYRPGMEHVIAPFVRLGWTLNYEMFFYVVFAALFFLSAWRRTITITILFGTLIVVGMVFHPKGAIPEFYTNIALLGFVAGLWVAMVLMRGAVTHSAAVRTVGWVVSLAIMALVALNYERIRFEPLTEVWIVLAAAIQVYLLATMTARAPRALVICGDASYAMYLFHMFPVALVVIVQRSLPAGMAIPSVILAAVLGIGSGIVIHYLIEVPLNRFVRRGVRRKAPSPPVAAPANTS